MNSDRRERALRELEADAARRRRPRRRDLSIFAGLGPTLRRLRRLRGMSQREVARAAGVTRPMISAYERERTLPSVETLDRLLATLGASLEELGRFLGDRGGAGRLDDPNGLP